MTCRIRIRTWAEEETDQTATRLRLSILSATPTPRTMSTGWKACHSTILIPVILKMTIWRDHHSHRLHRQTTCFSTGVLRMSASLVTPITPHRRRRVRHSISPLRQVQTLRSLIFSLITRQVVAQALSTLIREMALFSLRSSAERF